MIIVVTGGMGYIGSHTAIDLLESGYTVISIDNYSNSSPNSIDRIEKITGVRITNHNVDLADALATSTLFEQIGKIDGIIHFAAHKAVGESVEQPLNYYENNLNSLINVLRAVKVHKIEAFIFSSSSSIYGSPKSLPVTESYDTLIPESPYAYSKLVGEQIVKDAYRGKQGHACLLRYFNPVGAHPSGLIGELPLQKPSNLLPVITQSAIGKIPPFKVFGDDYDTRDGSCVRDYIHVCDLANAHTLALERIMLKKQNELIDVFNIGTGSGITVLEMISAFEKENNVQLDYEIAGRRPGDVAAIFANSERAQQQLNWEVKYSLEDMVRTAWVWEKNLKALNLAK